MSCRSALAARISRRTVVLGLGLAAAAGLCVALAGPTRAATVKCPGTFQVLHNDRIGKLSLPKGPYTITATGLGCATASQHPAGPYWVSIYKDSNITCPQSTRLFAAFLQRPDGSLPKPWVISVATGSFRRGKSSPYGFVAKPAFNVSARARTRS